jgi:hypothetical protein
MIVLIHTWLLKKAVFCRNVAWTPAAHKVAFPQAVAKWTKKEADVVKKVRSEPHPYARGPESRTDRARGLSPCDSRS